MALRMKECRPARMVCALVYCRMPLHRLSTRALCELDLHGPCHFSTPGSAGAQEPKRQHCSAAMADVSNLHARSGRT